MQPDIYAPMSRKCGIGVLFGKRYGKIAVKSRIFATWNAAIFTN